MTLSDEKFRPRWDWLFFYVEHVKPGLIRLDYDYFFAFDVIWHDPQDHRMAVTMVGIPMENTASLVVSVSESQAFYSLLSKSGGLLEPKRGCLAAATNPTPQGLQSTDDIKALLRQLGPMEVQYP